MLYLFLSVLSICILIGNIRYHRRKSGYYDIVSRKVYKETTYSLTDYNLGYHRGAGKETNRVDQITYRNGRVEFKTYSFEH